MSYRYAVLGAGAQGVAVAYDLARFGRASYVLLVDVDADKACTGAKRVNTLLGKDVVIPGSADVADGDVLAGALSDVDAVVSAISYKLNEKITDAAISAGVHMVDLGGNTAVVKKQHMRIPEAIAAGVSIVPDCGMGPGFNLSIANSIARSISAPRSVTIYCGGLPQQPEGELKYALCFSMGGLVNEYSGFADVLEGGQLKKKRCLESVETVVDPYGEFEASYTSGGLSSAPWSFKETFPTLKNLAYKTLRYPGHWKLLQKFRKEGRLREELEARLGTTPQEFPDLGIIIVRGDGADAEGKEVHVEKRAIAFYNDKTGFTAMQQMTGFHASIVAILAVSGKIPRGVLSVEMIDGDLVIKEMAKRGIITK